MIDLDVVPIVIILLAYSLDLMQQRRNWLKPLVREVYICHKLQVKVKNSLHQKLYRQIAISSEKYRCQHSGL
jgi:hypothetical protein